jgi:cell division protein FtsB
MENQFYRKTPPSRHLIRDILKKAIRNKKRTTILLISVVMIVYLTFDNKGVIARIRLESQKKQLEQKILQAESETKELHAQIKALEGDKKTIERIAREKYGMARDGETVYRVKKD